MKALLIEVNFTTGERAGGINPRDPGLRGNPQWQNLDSIIGKELRLVVDQRETKSYEGIPGVIVLDGKEAINEAIQKNFSPRAVVVDMTLLLAHASQKGVSLDELSGKTMEEIARIAVEHGLAGATVNKVSLVE